MLSLVRRVAIAAVATYAAMTQACSFPSDSKLRQLADAYEQHLANRAMVRMSESTTLSDYVQAKDEFMYTVLVRDGQSRAFGYEEEERRRKRVRGEVIDVARRSAANTLEDATKGAGIGSLLVENPKFEEGVSKDQVNEPYLLLNPPSDKSNKRLIAPKVNPGIHGFRAGVDLGDWVSVRWKSDYALGNGEVEARVRMRMLGEIYGAGFYERKLDEHSDSWGGGLFWWKFGGTYSRDDNGKGEWLLEFNSARK